MPDLRLRKITHPQARDNYRVILKIDGDYFEVGSIGIQDTTRANTAWTWGIDTVIPMRETKTQGQGQDRRDCMQRFKAAWAKLCTDPGLIDEFWRPNAAPGASRDAVVQRV